MLDEGILQHVPIVRTLVSLGKVGVPIQDGQFVKIFLRFLSGLSQIPKDDWLKMVERLHADPSYGRVIVTAGSSYCGRFRELAVCEVHRRRSCPMAFASASRRPVGSSGIVCRRCNRHGSRLTGCQMVSDSSLGSCRPSVSSMCLEVVALSGGFAVAPSGCSQADCPLTGEVL